MEFDVEKWMKERKEKRYKGAQTLEGLRQFLLGKGYKYIVVSYDGYGDSGEAYQAEGYLTIKSFVERDKEIQYVDHGEWNHTKKGYDPAEDKWKNCTRNQKNIEKIVAQYNEITKDNKSLTDRLTDLIDYDWYNNEGGQGQVIFDLKKGEIFVDGEYNTRVAEPITEKLYTDGRPAEYQY